MENRGMLPAGWNPPKPTTAEIADYKHRKANGEKLERALLLAIDQLTAHLEINARISAGQEPESPMRGLTRRELINATSALTDVVNALNALSAYMMPPYGYTEEMEGESDAEG